MTVSDFNMDFFSLKGKNAIVTGGKAEPEIAVFQMEIRMTQKPEMTPAPFADTTKAETNASADIAAASTATPAIAAQGASKTQTPDAGIDQLMDDLDSALDELEAAITTVDQDILTDATLTALGK